MARLSKHMWIAVLMQPLLFPTVVLSKVSRYQEKESRIYTAVKTIHIIITKQTSS